MDSMTLIIVTIPIFFPIVMKFNFDPIWFGVIVVMVGEMDLWNFSISEQTPHSAGTSHPTINIFYSKINFNRYYHFDENR